MTELKLYITNNPWINNGLARLLQGLKNNLDSKVNVSINPDYVSLESESNEKIFDSISEDLKYLAITNGTYNFSQSFKIINKEIKNPYSPPSSYPKNKDELDKNKSESKIIISDEDREILKKNKISDTNKKQQIWKMRLSFLGTTPNYFKIGLDLKSTSEFNKLISNTSKKNICPYCGQYSGKMVDSKQFFNPLMNEHHNNEIEGIGVTRRKNKMCPSCAIASFFSLFDKYIPFYWNSKNTFLALPVVNDLILLEKILNNLSFSGQYIDFNNADVVRYSTNIKSFNSHDSNSAALLSLLHNIQNQYSKDEIECEENSFFNLFKETELMELTDWIFINKDSFSITKIKADSRIYKILEGQNNPKAKKDLEDGNVSNIEKIYFVLDFLNKINFNFKPADAEKFYNSFLTLNYKKIADSLFMITKYDINKINVYGGNSPLYLFNKVFLDRIMGEIVMLNDKLKNSAKNLATTIGRGFYKDIGLMTKYAYSTDEKNFKKVVEESSFLMAKRMALSSNVNYYLNNEDIEIIFDEVNNDNFDEFKSYFVSFMSSSAIYWNFKENKNNKENKK